MTGKKRTSSGQIKPSNEVQNVSTDALMTEPTPPCAQPQLPSNTAAESQSTTQTEPEPKQQKQQRANTQTSAKPTQQNPSKPYCTTRRKRQKLPKLPDNATVTKRPLLHPAIPSPFSSSSSPKVLYITASSPYIPAVKRVRKLLCETTRREKQSLAAQSKRKRNYSEANGRLAPADVEREIADGASKKNGGAGAGKRGEEVYLKATGRAIPRALELGVHFQGEEDCWVRVEMGSVRAVDDIEVRSRGTEDPGAQGENEAVQEEGGDIPETRIRTLSSVTVSIGLK